MTGTMWRVAAGPGRKMKAGEPVIIHVSTKMEIEALGSACGRLPEVHCKPGRIMHAGDVIAAREEDD